ncbi:MAG: hypothetical protein ACK5ML_10815 [Lachnospiraceae bacterium]
MEEIFKQYGQTIIAVIGVLAIVGIVTLVIGDDTNSIVYKAFADLINNFYASANQAAGLGTP